MINAVTIGKPKRFMLAGAFAGGHILAAVTLLPS
jgi:hypothetical protein